MNKLLSAVLTATAVMIICRASVSANESPTPNGYTYPYGTGPTFTEDQVAEQLAINASGDCRPYCRKICENEPTPGWVYTNHLEGAWRARDEIKYDPNTPTQPYEQVYMQGGGPALEPASVCNHITPKK